MENNLDTYGMSSVEEFESTYSKESVMDELLREKVQKFLLDNAKVTEVSEDEYYQEYDEGEDLFRPKMWSISPWMMRQKQKSWMQTQKRLRKQLKPRLRMPGSEA